MFVPYLQRRMARKNFVQCEESIPCISLFSISPMSQSSADDVSEDISTKFDVEVHL